DAPGGGDPPVGVGFFSARPTPPGVAPSTKPRTPPSAGRRSRGPGGGALGGAPPTQPTRGVPATPLQLTLSPPPGGPPRRAGACPPAQEGGVQALGDQVLAHGGDRPQAGPQGGDDLRIGAPPAAGVVGQQEDTGVGQFAGRRLARGNQLLQVRPFLRRQSHPV